VFEQSVLIIQQQLPRYFKQVIIIKNNDRETIGGRNTYRQNFVLLVASAYALEIRKSITKKETTFNVTIKAAL
jgi:hypothetical protein